MARSTEDVLREALDFHHTHGLDVARAQAVPGSAPTSTRESRRWGRPVWIPVAAFAGVAGLVVAVVIAVSGPGGGRSALPSDRATVVAEPSTSHSAASPASSQPVTPSGSSQPAPAAAAVPGLIGLTQAQAEATLRSAGFTMRRSTVPSQDAMKGRIVAQSPAEGTLIAPGDVVTISVGTGAEMIEIPESLVGMSVDDAKEFLTRTGIAVTDGPKASPEPRGQVLSATRSDNGRPVAPGDAIPSGVSVRLIWSNQSQFVMPNVTQLSPDDAARTLEQAGWNGDAATLTAGAATVETSQLTQVGLIITQHPAPGVVIGNDGKITVKVAVLRRIYLPDLVGMTVAQAQGTLELMGWQGDIQVAENDLTPPSAADAGRIAAQNPPVQSQITVFDKVAVSVYRG